MKNLKSSKCEVDGCSKNAGFNFPDKLGAKRCGPHKLPGMVNKVGRRVCAKDGCNSYGVFGNRDTPKVLFCREHKAPEMVNLKEKVCEHPSCQTRPCYNHRGEKAARFCEAHKQNGMVNVKDKTCTVDGCWTQPVFNFKNTKPPLYCEAHKKPGMTNVVDKRCKGCDLFIVNKTPHLCQYCNKNRRIKTRESTVKKFLDENKYEFEYDKSIGVCSKHRPDFRLDFLTHSVIVECDEDQHDQYDYGCELRRMCKIRRSIGQYTVFLRFNPDAYKIDDKVFKTRWATRLVQLKERIEYYRSQPIPTDVLFEVEYLFYLNNRENEVHHVFMDDGEYSA